MLLKKWNYLINHYNKFNKQKNKLQVKKINNKFSKKKYINFPYIKLIYI